jgi:hypoxanthine phosphoribosyltransferase
MGFKGKVCETRFCVPLRPAYYRTGDSVQWVLKGLVRPLWFRYHCRVPALRTLISAEQIGERVRDMGQQIDADYPEGPLYLISILKGSFIFLADLIRTLKRHTVRVEFMGISSYGSAKTSSGQVKVTRDLDLSIEGQHVLIVEDIVDSGVTLSYLTRVLAQRRPRSLEIATLLDKPERRIQPVDVKYVGFEIPDEFVVGYGLDYAEDYRNLGGVYVLEE